MATSGTVATTSLDTAILLEHALRRCGLRAASQTPETVTIARESLYMLLLSLANRGINLWCVEKQLHGVQTGKAVYPSDAGTIDVLNVFYSQPTQATGTDTSTATSYKTELASATRIVRIGIKFSAVTASSTLILAFSDDDATYTTELTKTRTDWATNTWYWFDLPTLPESTYFRATMSAAATWSEFYLASAINDLPVTQWNRDTWSAINNKNQLGRPSTSYYLEKLLTPQITVWPIPNNDTDQICMFVHRQVQDIGTLVQTLEIPNRWIEGITWQLALRLAFEIPEVDPARRSEVVTMSQQYLLEAEGDESDGAPIFLAPNIQVYTR